MVSVKHDHQLPRGPGQGLIYVAGLSMAVVGPGEVATSQPGGEPGNLGAAAIIQDIHRLPGVVHSQAADRRPLDDLQRLVIGGDEDIHLGQAGGALQVRPGAGGPGYLEMEEEELDKGVDFGSEKGQADKYCGRGEAQGIQAPPGEVAELEGQPDKGQGPA